MGATQDAVPSSSTGRHMTPREGISLDDTRRAHRLLLEQAFFDYLNKLASPEFERKEPFLPFDFEFLQNRRWRTSFAASMVVGDLCELTNKLNTWQSMLTRWAVWNEVIGNNEDAATLSLRDQFCDSLAHHCMLLPSSIRDVLVAVATDALHQLRMAQDSNVPDALLGDARPPAYKPKRLKRPEKEAQLCEMLSRWTLGAELWEAVQLIDSPDYKRATTDYRNSHAHHVGPRLGIGEVRPIIRSVVEATELKRNSDGTFSESIVVGKSSVRYAFGGLMPIDFEKARLLNLEQYRVARRAYEAYIQLLKAEVRQLPAASPA